VPVSGSPFGVAAFVCFGLLLLLLLLLSTSITSSYAIPSLVQLKLHPCQGKPQLHYQQR